MQQKFKCISFFTRFILVLGMHIFVIETITAQYQLQIKYINKDSLFKPQSLQLQTNFNSQLQCINYVNNLTSLLNLRGYAAASVDSIFYQTNNAQITLYVGEQQSWIQVNTSTIEPKALQAAGFNNTAFINSTVDINRLAKIKEGLLNYYENNGYPFAAVFLDNVVIKGNTMSARLSCKKGPLYHIDSISVRGTAKIANQFLQRHLGITNNSSYNKEKLSAVSKRLSELAFVQEFQPAELQMLGTGSILNIYLQPKPSSQVNFLIGVLPGSDQTGKLRLTGDANLNLKNTLGTGETILFNWQQLQVQSPRLNIGFQQPFIFHSPFGVDFSFGIFKKDSAFVQLNAQLGLQYLLNANQSGKLFVQQQNTFLLASGIDSNLIKATKLLPLNIDVSAINIGVDYEFNNTNYRFNPVSGNEFKLVSSVGLKTITRNNNVLALTDATFNYGLLYDSLQLKVYQFKFKLAAAHYFTTGKNRTLKVAVSCGLFKSPNIFRNELFQIGGYKILRGFDEESIYATQYGIATTEYRYITGLNSYLYGFIDAGMVKKKYQQVNIAGNFVSAGIGLSFETKVGLLNMSFAVGKRNDLTFNLNQSAKIHFGYINYF